jgi:hypothetical protein
LERRLVEQYYDYNELIRHERGHCNGWRHDIVTAEDAKTQKPAWPRVAEKPKADVAEKPKADVAGKPSVEKKVAAKPTENAPTARPTARTAERPARQPMPSGRAEHMPWPLAMLASAIVTPIRAIARFR